MFSENIMTKNCPENGSCSFEILKHKTLNILKDNLGETYPEIVEGNQLVLKFKYQKNTDTQVADSHYTEEVYIELDPEKLQKATAILKGEKLLFARLCYCKGQTGYYRIRTGDLSIKKIKDDTYQLEFHFEINEVPQVITSISQIFSLK